MANLDNSPSDDDENENMESIVEMATAGLKIGLFCLAIYALKEAFLLLQEMYYIVEGQTNDVILFVAIPCVILVIICAYLIFFLKKF